MTSKEEAAPKIGSGHASAMARQGLRELRAAIYPESNVSQQGEYGLYGTRTPGEVAESRRSEALDRDEEPTSALDERLRQAESREANREPSKEPERD
jgi:hypothetical protein